MERMKSDHKSEVTTLTSQIDALASQVRTDKSEFQAKLRETELLLAKSAQEETAQLKAHVQQELETRVNIAKEKARAEAMTEAAQLQQQGTP